MNCSDCKNTGTQICTVCCTYQGGVPDRWESKPVTNYDRLVSKSPEELADEIFFELSQFPDKASLLAWLQKEVGT